MGSLELVPAKLLVRVQVDPAGQQGLTLGKGTNVPMLQGGLCSPKIFMGCSVNSAGTAALLCKELGRIRLLIPSEYS